jgi:hypothetical protein
MHVQCIHISMTDNKLILKQIIKFRVDKFRCSSIKLFILINFILYFKRL